MIKNSNQTTSNEDWKKSIVFDSQGRVINYSHNYIVYLENHPKYVGRFRYNDWFHTYELDGKEITDFDTDRIYDDIWNDLHIDNYKRVEESIRYVCYTHKYNPVIDYLNSLKWDGTERIATIFNKCFGVEDNEMVRTMAKIWFRDAVTRAFEPGHEIYNFIVVANDPHNNASKFCDLVFPKLVSDYPTNPHPKKSDMYFAHRGCWVSYVYNIDDLPMKQVEAIRCNILNATADDFYREPGERTCVFIGNVDNPKVLEQLTDRSHRTIPLWANDIAVPADITEILTKDIVDQLWAEAVHQYKSWFWLESYVDPEYKNKVIENARRNYKQ